MSANDQKSLLSRRRFLGTAAASTLGVSAGPFLGGVRRAHAARGSAVACIRFWLAGGARTSALWDGNHVTKFNPYGLKYEQAPSGVDYYPSALWPDSMLTVLDKMSVVRTLFHGEGIGTNHRACSERMLTGGLDSKLPGWAVVANRELRAPTPSVVIGSTGGFAERLGSLGPAFSSIVVPTAGSIATIRDALNAGFPAAEHERIRRLRRFLSKGVIQRTPSKIVQDLPLQQSLAADVVGYLKAGSQFELTANGDQEVIGTLRKDLVDPVTNDVIRDAGERLTNADLRALFRIQDNGSGGVEGQYGEGAMIALRMVQSGVRSVTVSRGGWDTHQGEQDKLTTRLGSLGTAITGLITALDALAPISGDPTKTSALDDVLFVVDSEFSRDNTGPDGFNGDDGSDHQSTYARYFSAMFAGGGIAGGRAIGTTDEAFEPVDGETYHSSRVNATIYDLLGIDHSKYLAGFSRPIEGLYG